MSNYGVNASIPKTLIRHIVKWVANTNVDKMSQTTLLDIIDTPISPELIPADENGNIKQKTEDLVGPYELHDFFLFHFIKNGFRPSKIFYLASKAFAKRTEYTEEYTEETIKHWLSVFCRRFFNQQFKRSCMPDGPQISDISLSPRGAWVMPSDANSTQWINECSEL
jgi:NAD+ synthase (glutamine-hydrolysing)